MATRKTAAKKKAAKKKAVKKKKTARRTAARRELIDTGTNKLFIRRNKRGTSFKESGGCRPLAELRTAAARLRRSPSAEGDRGDKRR